MNIFCGVQATGRGHLSRFAVIREMLESAGHSVYGYATGMELPPYAKGICRFDPGPTFFIRGNRIRWRPTIMHCAKAAAALPSCWKALRAVIRESQFDRAIVDFEPISARAVCSANVPLVIFDNQTLTLLELPAFEGVAREVRSMRRFVNLYYGVALRQAERILTYSLAPAQPSLPGQRIIPPCVRMEVSALQPRNDGHILFYSSIGEVPDGLVEFARANPTVEIRAYVSSKPSSPTPSNIVLPDRNDIGFLQDFASCRAYVANAGFESIAESVTFGKPLMVVPIAGQWEQKINAALVKAHGIGDSAEDFSAKTFERILRREQGPNDEVRSWIASGRDSLRKEILA
jgi:uncharacterized protein (TIGR00661 family)